MDEGHGEVWADRRGEGGGEGEVRAEEEAGEAGGYLARVQTLAVGLVCYDVSLRERVPDLRARVLPSVPLSILITPRGDS